jgi:hypothetical protein
MRSRVDDMEIPETPSIFWVNILERDVWILLNVNEKKLGVILSFTEGGKEFLRVAGYHLGETMFVGERRNVMSIKVERILKNQQTEILSKIHEALPFELRGLPVAFL